MEILPARASSRTVPLIEIPRHLSSHREILPPEYQFTPEGRAAAEAVYGTPEATPTDLSLTSTIPLPTVAGHVAVHIPRLGIDLTDLPLDRAAPTVEAALRAGFRHLSAPQMPEYEAAIGDGLRQSGVPRRDVFVIIKTRAATGDDAETIHRCCAESIARIDGGDEGRDPYVDLFLASFREDSGPWLWPALERLRSEGRARSIGVCDVTRAELEKMQGWAAGWPPQVCQLELHPWLQMRDVIAFCREQGIVVAAACSLGNLREIHGTTLARVAEGERQSPAQVLARYGLQKGWVVQAQLQDEDEVREGAEVLGWAIRDEDMEALGASWEHSED